MRSIRSVSAALAAALVTMPSALAGNPQVVHVTLVRIDNGYLVPANDPTFDPAQWETYQVWFTGDEPGLRLLGAHLNFQSQFFQHPTNDSMFPQDESVYAAVPSARFDSFIDVPGIAPAQITPVGLFWTPTVFNGSWFAVAPTSSLPLLTNTQLRVAQFTVAPGTLNRFTLITQGNASVRRENGTQSIYSLTGPLTLQPGSVVIRETGDHADSALTLDVNWLWEGGPLGFDGDGRLRVFFPAARVQAIDSVTGPWTARKAYLNGVFGVLAESTFTIDDDAIGSFSLAFTSGASQCDLRVINGLGESAFRPFGYWAPVASTLLAGDTNDDGVVDFTDLNNILTDFGGAPSAWRTDFDASGTVDFADLNAVLSAFGSTD